MVDMKGTKLRKEAKAMTAGRRKLKEKHRMMRQWVLNKYNLRVAGTSNQPDFRVSDSESTHDTAAIRRKLTKNKAWDLPAYHKEQPGPVGVSLRTMLQTAEDCYKLATKDLDNMSLYHHMRYIQESIQEPGVDASQALVTKKLICMAQHQKYLAEQNYVACVAKQAVLGNLPENLKADFKTCEKCFDKFKLNPKPRTNTKSRKTCLHNYCQYHPGRLRSYNDRITDSKAELAADFLEKGNVTLHEFGLWIHTCYWDCCGGKLLEIAPGAGERSQKKKKVELEIWEKRHEMDGNIGCTVDEEHRAME